MNLNIHNVVRALIIDQGKILLCKTIGNIYVQKGYWPKLLSDFYFLPGGHIEFGESAKNALYRELIEELGEEFTIGEFLGCIETSYDPKYYMCHNHEYSFIFKANSSKVKFNLSLKQVENHIESVWIDLDKIGELDLRPNSIKQVIFDLNDQIFISDI